MLEELESHINRNFSILKESKLLIAISGGIDSVVLTHLCYNSKLNIALAHCNFNLRGEESDTDEAFVVQLAERLNLEVFTQRFDTKKYAEDNKCSIQMAARELRYNWFEELAEQLQFDYILTAHHADDNLETFLINFTRGTGLEGLTGIPEVNGKFVRPLLPFSSEAIITYAKDNKIKWRDDSSNASVKYLRNKLRHEVIPILKEINPSLLLSFQNTLDNLNDVSTVVEDRIELFLEQAIESIDKDKIVLKVSEFKKQNNPKTYLFEVLKDYGFTAWNDVANLLEAQSGKYVSSNTHRLIKHGEYLLLSEMFQDNIEDIIIQDITQEVETPLGVLTCSEVKEISQNTVTSIYVDKNLLKFPLFVRKRKEGDVFYPLGMKGKKKLSKYLKDEKLSLLEKEQTLLLCSNNDIVWVINKRADNRFRVTDKTKAILKIELK